MEELKELELVVAAPHSALRVATDQTARMVAAVKTKGVHILGHPRGRMYGSRPDATLGVTDVGALHHILAFGLSRRLPTCNGRFLIDATHRRKIGRKIMCFRDSVERFIANSAARLCIVSSSTAKS